MRVKEDNEKAGLKLNIQKTKTMASSPITSWQIDREKLETVTDVIFLHSKIIVDVDYSLKNKRHMSPGKKGMINLNRVLKSRDITLPTNFNRVKALIFPVVMYGCECWSIKKTKHQRIDGAGEDSWESLGLHGDQTSQS